MVWIKSHSSVWPHCHIAVRHDTKGTLRRTSKKAERRGGFPQSGAHTPRTQPRAQSSEQHEVHIQLPDPADCLDHHLGLSHPSHEGQCKRPIPGTARLSAQGQSAKMRSKSTLCTQPPMTSMPGQTLCLSEFATTTGCPRGRLCSARERGGEEDRGAETTSRGASRAAYRTPRPSASSSTNSVLEPLDVEGSEGSEAGRGRRPEQRRPSRRM